MAWNFFRFRLLYRAQGLGLHDCEIVDYIGYTLIVDYIGYTLILKAFTQGLYSLLNREHSRANHLQVNFCVMLWLNQRQSRKGSHFSFPVFLKVKPTSP